jgi:subtilase family serine protease
VKPESCTTSLQLLRLSIYGVALGLTLLLLTAGSIRAAEKQTLHTTVPAAAARLQGFERLPATNRLRLAIGLPFRNQTALTNLFREIYDPHSTNFHRYLTPEQFTAQFGPTEQDYQTVITYAQSNHLEIAGTFSNRAVLDVAGSIADLENMFQVHLGTYPHPTENRRFFGPDVEPTVDAGIPIQYVSGLDNFDIPRPKGRSIPVYQNPTRNPEAGTYTLGTNSLYGGADFRTAYANGTPLNGAGQVVGLFELDGYNFGDIEKYEILTGIAQTNGSGTLVGGVPVLNVLLGVTDVAGANNGEVALDIEMAIAMAPGLNYVNVYEGTNSEDMINEMASPTQGDLRPNQISCSWGIAGNTNIPAGLMELAMQGQSFLYASGDNGAYQNGIYSGPAQAYLYMTGVGGTQLFMNGIGASWSNEVVWHDSPGTNFAFFSPTGGVLSQDVIPAWQADVSMAFNGGSTQYRNVPDVAMVARDIISCATVVPTNNTPPDPGEYFSTVGTSAAAPLWAGYIALVNQQAAAMGSPPVGFLNPALYAIGQGPLYASCFHDITSGNNAWFNSVAGTGTDGLYNATLGYDLCTGWGTPTGTNLINALLAYAGAVWVDFNYMGPQNGSYDLPFETLTSGVNSVQTNGNIWIRTAGSSHEALQITKPMTIRVSDGAATIGP